MCGRVARVQASTSVQVESSTSPRCSAPRRGRWARSHSSCSWQERRPKLAKLAHLSEPAPGQEAGPCGRGALVTATSAGRPPGARTTLPGRQVWGPLPETPGLCPPAPCCPQAPSVWRTPKANWGRRQGCRSETLRLLLPLEPLAPAGTRALSLHLRPLSELSRQRLARPFASNRRRACRPPGTPPGPGDPALPPAPPPGTDAPTFYARSAPHGWLSGSCPKGRAHLPRAGRAASSRLAALLPGPAEGLV